MNNQTQTKQAVVITGCSGLIGQRLIAAIQDRYQIIGLDVKEPDEIPHGGIWLRCDMTCDKSVAEAIESIACNVPYGIASVVHLAAYYDFSGEPSPLYQDLTVDGTRRLLEGLQKHSSRINIEQFIFSSSLLVMKPAEGLDEQISEESEVDPQWAYPESKVAAENVIQELHGDIPAVTVRLAGVFDEDCHSLPISQQIKRIYENDLESHFFPGNPERGQAFIHLDDLTSFFVRTIDTRRVLGDYEIFLAAEEDLMSYEQLQDEIGKRIYGSEWSTIRIPKFAAKAGAWVKDQLSPEEDSFIKPWMVDLADQHYPVDVGKARRQLNWKPQHSLRSTLPEMISRLLDNPRRWYEVNNLKVPDDLPTVGRK